jgi:FMN-dependent NADH-azoreductase
MHLLHLDSSARASSVSRRLGAEFRRGWSQSSGSHTTTYRDLALDPPPPITEAWTEICDNLLRDQIFELDQLHRGVRTAAQAEAWAVVEPLLAELVAADIVLVSAPMYNFGIPAALKAWIDQVTFPRMDLGHRRFVVVAARGGNYLPGMPRHPFDHHARYLSDFFQGHYNVPAPQVITVEWANSRVDPALADQRSAHDESVRAALEAAQASGLAHGSAVGASEATGVAS